MKILHLTTHFNTGGITTYILTLSQQLARLGHHVCVVSSGGNMEEDFLQAGVEHVTLDLRTKFFLSWKIFSAVPRITAMIREKEIDVIHAHTRVTHFLAHLVSRKTGIPYVITYHGFYHIKPVRRLFPCLGSRVISISDQVTDHLVHDFHVAPDRVETIRNGINLEAFRAVSPEERERQKILFGCEGKKVAGVIARLADVKGHRFLIDAVDLARKRVPDIFLMIIGTGREEQGLKDQVRRQGLEDYIRFFPAARTSAGFLAAFDCFVLPSLDEGLGLVIMEAQASGLPVAASRTGGILSLIDDGKTGLLVEPGNAEALAEALVRILSQPDLAASLGAQAREKAQREYGAEIMTEKIVKVYEKALSNSQ